MPVESLEARYRASEGYKVDVGRGGRVGRASSEWLVRPEDERFLSLSKVVVAVRGRSDRSHGEQLIAP